MTYDEWLANLRKNGVRLDAYNCPRCDAQLHTVTNSTDIDWDGLAHCPRCDKMFMKITKARNGGTEIKQ